MGVRFATGWGGRLLGSERSMRLWRAAVVAALVFSFAIEAVPTSMAQSAAPGLQVHFLDAGVGDATWITTTGHNYLIDCGPANNGKQLVLSLESAGVLKLDGLVMTDTATVRVAGCTDVVRSLQPGFLLLPRTGQRDALPVALASILN